MRMSSFLVTSILVRPPTKMFLALVFNALRTTSSGLKHWQLESNLEISQVTARSRYHDNRCFTNSNKTNLLLMRLLPPRSQQVVALALLRQYIQDDSTNANSLPSLVVRLF